MSGAELRRFVGGPFPNLMPGTAGSGPGDGIVGGPYANLVVAPRPPAAPAIAVVDITDVTDLTGTVDSELAPA